MAGPVRTVVVASPSWRSEAGIALRAAFHIVLWSAVVIFGRGKLATGGAAAQAAPFERPFAELDGADQRTFRALREGITEAEARRGETRRWPTVDELAGEGIPPFSPDPLDKAGYRWSLLRDRTVFNYVGTPAPGSGRETFVVVITEPDPGSVVDPQAVVDEVHHRLVDGTLIHVNVWLGPGLDDPGRAVDALNPEAGWQRIVVGAPPAR